MNFRVPTYWFWFVAFFGAGCLLPVVPLQQFGRTEYTILAYLYAGAPVRKTVLPIHTSAAAVLGIVGGVLQHLWGRRRGINRNRVETTFSLRSMLVGVAVFAMVFGLLKWVNAPPAAFLCILVAGAGQPCTGLLVGLCDRKHNTEDSAP